MNYYNQFIGRKVKIIGRYVRQNHNSRDFGKLLFEFQILSDRGGLLQESDFDFQIDWDDKLYPKYNYRIKDIELID